MTENESGIYPTGYRVLVKPDPIEKVTEGGIVIPETSRESHGQAQTAGLLIEVGSDCWGDYPEAWAKAGDRVMFAKYGGLPLTGADGELYRLLNDEQITAQVEQGVQFTEFAARKGLAA